MRLCLQSGVVAGIASVMLAAAPPEASSRIRLVVRPDARTGKLVRSVAGAARAVNAEPVTPRIVPSLPAPDKAQRGPQASMGPLDDVIDRIAREHELDPQLVRSVIRVESNYNPYAVSNKGAQGLMQLVPGTARRFGVSNVFNPVQNIEGGVKYLKHLLNLHENNYALALAAYNAGEGAVAQYGGIPPFPETRNYVYQVWTRWGAAKRKEEADQRRSRAHAEVAVSTTMPPRLHNEIRELVDENGRVMYISQ
jgi:soluble lytic murein transglycosylase-like protein